MHQQIQLLATALLVVVLLCATTIIPIPTALGFSIGSYKSATRTAQFSSSKLHASSKNEKIEPQVLSSGYSSSDSLVEALQGKVDALSSKINSPNQ